MKKKVLTFILLICMVVSMISVATFAAEIEPGGAYSTDVAADGEEASQEDENRAGSGEDVTGEDASEEDATDETIDDGENENSLDDENSEIRDVDDENVANDDAIGEESTEDVTFDEQTSDSDDAEKETAEEVTEEEQTTDASDDDAKEEESETTKKDEKETKKNSIKKADSSTTLNVTASEIKSLGATKAINNKLLAAKQTATESKPYTVKVAKGSYTLNGKLEIGNNTTLDLTGVTLNNGSTGVMLVIYGHDSGKGYCFKNIKVKGGTFDHKNGTSTCVKIGHVQNITFENVTFKNAKNAHLLETGGVSGLTVKKCTFQNQEVDKNKLFYEAIQIDIPSGEPHFNMYQKEALISKNVVIDSCKFDNVPRGVGNHTGILNSNFTGLTVKNCTFTNCKSCAVQTINWNNVNITNNTIKNCPRAVWVFNIKEGEGTYLPSYFGKTGSSNNFSSSNSIVKNININNNNISVTGNDKYASYEKRAIYVGGQDYSEKPVPKYSSDKSGGLPKGNYYVTGIAIKNNTIVTNGHGIRLDDAKKAAISGNKISFKLDSGDKNSYYGIHLRSAAQADSINSNSITNAPVNGIMLNAGSKASNIKNNTITSPGKYGISLEDSNTTAGNIDGNTVRKTINNGIFVYNKAKCTSITNNTVDRRGTNNKASQTACIKVNNNSSATNIKNNVVYAAGLYGIIATTKATATNITGNHVYNADSNNAIKVDSSSKTSTTNIPGKNYIIGSYGADVSYRTHVQTYGWQSFVSNGTMSGTTGKSKRLEAINIKISNTHGYDFGIRYTTHCQTYGWLPWSANGKMNGTSGESKRLEAIKIQLTGKDANKFDVYYRVHAQNYGWLSWAKNGQPAGTSGYSKRLEGIQILVVPKGTKVPSTLYGIKSKNSKAYIRKS